MNPTLALAVEAMRKELIHAIKPQQNGPYSPGRRRLSELDDPANLARWQPAVRLSTLGWELGSGLSVHTTPASSVELHANGQLMVSLVRPTLDELRKQALRTLDFREKAVGSEVLTSGLNEGLTQLTPAIAFWSALLPLHPDRTGRTLELIELTLQLASAAVLRIKHALAVPRPYEVNMAIQPLILTPAHGAFPSGHATESSAVSTLLAYLVSDSGHATSPDYADALRVLAQRIARNRVVLGVHYEIDSIVGQLLGETLGSYVAGVCTGAVETPAGAFNGQGEIDDLWMVRTGVPALQQMGCRALDGQIRPALNRQLAWLWQRARAEWGYTGA
jgi:hypothetical protein